jgi:hypothetical protein
LLSRRSVRPERQRFRRAQLRTAERELAPEWRAWIAENLLNGAEAPLIVAELARRGVSTLVAARHVAEIAASPAFVAARQRLVPARRIELVQKLLLLQSRQAEHPRAIERRATPSAAELFDRYFATSTPVIFRDLMQSWSALGKWTPEYLRERYGETSVRVTEDREADPLYDAHTEAHTRETKLADFVTRVLAAGESNDFYMVAKNRNLAHSPLRELFADVEFPSGWFDEALLATSSALWFGPRGTVTPLHHDASAILFCQVYGRKRWHLASPLEVSLFEGAHAMYSAVDPEKLDDESHQAVVFKDFVLEPGEALFIPAGWWHHVRALDVSISLAVNHFARQNSFDDWYTPGQIR